MNHLSILRYVIVLLLFTTATSCRKDTPSPKPYAIQVHIVGNRLGSSASSVVSIYDHAGARMKGGPRYEQTYTDAVDETYDLGQFGDGDKVLALLETAPSQDATGVLRADILVNGVVRASCELTGALRGANSCEVETAEL